MRLTLFPVSSHPALSLASVSPQLKPGLRADPYQSSVSITWSSLCSAQSLWLCRRVRPQAGRQRMLHGSWRSWDGAWGTGLGQERQGQCPPGLASGKLHNRNVYFW